MSPSPKYAVIILKGISTVVLYIYGRARPVNAVSLEYCVVSIDQAEFYTGFRGAYFAEMQTTEVRKLLPESWGFLCPVHTPDGAPCGLKNHLSFLCESL